MRAGAWFDFDFGSQRPEGRKRAKSISVSPLRFWFRRRNPATHFNPKPGSPFDGNTCETETESESWFRDLEINCNRRVGSVVAPAFSANETRPRPSVRVETERVGTESNVESETLELKGTLKAKGKAFNPFRLKPK
jgi:hypothetical protein